MCVCVCVCVCVRNTFDIHYLYLRCHKQTMHSPLNSYLCKKYILYCSNSKHPAQKSGANGKKLINSFPLYANGDSNIRERTIRVESCWKAHASLVYLVAAVVCLLSAGWKIFPTSVEQRQLLTSQTISRKQFRPLNKIYARTLCKPFRFVTRVLGTT